MKPRQSEDQREQEARWRLDQLTSVGNELLWRARHISRQIQELVLQLLFEKARQQTEKPELGSSSSRPQPQDNATTNDLEEIVMASRKALPDLPGPFFQEEVSPVRAAIQEEIDWVAEAGTESFPASDPPSWTPVTAVGSPSQIDADRAACCLAPDPTSAATSLEQLLAEPDVLPHLLHQLETALISVTPYQEYEWQARVVDELRAARNNLGPPRSKAELAEGSYATIDQERPTLVRQENHLRQEQADLLTQARMLLLLLEKEAEDSTLDFSHIHRRVELLLEAVRRHQAQETGLLLESLCTDLGTGD